MEHVDSANQLPVSDTNNLQSDDQNKVITSSSRIVEEKDSDSLNRRCSIQIITSNLNYESFYCIKPTIVMSCLKKLYIAATPFNADDVQFFYKDHIIDDNDTPDMLGINNGDIIVVQMNCERDCKCDKDRIQ